MLPQLYQDRPEVATKTKSAMTVGLLLQGRRQEGGLYLSGTPEDGMGRVAAGMLPAAVATLFRGAKFYERASSSKVGSGMPAFQVGSRSSSRLPLGSKK